MGRWAQAQRRDSFGSGTSYQVPDGSLLIAGECYHQNTGTNLGNPYSRIAGAWTLGSNWYAMRLDVMLTRLTSTPHVLYPSIWADAAGLPGTLLNEGPGLNGLAVPLSPSVITFFGLGQAVTSGVKYHYGLRCSVSAAAYQSVGRFSGGPTVPVSLYQQPSGPWSSGGTNNIQIAVWGVAP